MSDTELPTRAALSRCEQGDPSGIDQLFKDLRNRRFIDALDDPMVYQNRQMPPNLKKLLSCLGASEKIPGVADRLVELAKTTEYAYDHPEGSLRRKALVESLASVVAPGPTLIQFLDGEITRSGKYRSSAVAVLARFGTPSSLEILDKRIFNPNTSVIAPNSRSVYCPHYCITLAQYRDRYPIMKYLLTKLFAMPELKRTVLDCILKDVIILGADPGMQVELAPLNSATNQAPLIAELVVDWTIQNGQVLSFLQALPGVSRRITDLLGQPSSSPASDQARDVRIWAIQVFEFAKRATEDRKKQSAIEEALKRLR